MKPIGNWYESEAGASPDTISALTKAVPNLPDSYITLLETTNGAETKFRASEISFCLDSAEDSLAYFTSGAYTTDNVFVFGGTGGGTVFAFKLSGPEQLAIVEYDPIDPEGSMTIIASSFDDLLKQLPPHEA